MKAHKIITALRANGNELKELISLSSFIDQKADGEGYAEDDFVCVVNYNNLSKIKLHIGLFVTCKDGVPMGDMLKTMSTRSEIKKAESEVVFKGWHSAEGDGSRCA